MLRITLVDYDLYSTEEVNSAAFIDTVSLLFRTGRKMQNYELLGLFKTVVFIL